MKKYLYVLLFVILISRLFAETQPIVQVDPVLNLSDEVWLDAVCDAATDNVLFTLKFLGQFEVISDLVVEKETDKLENNKLLDQETFDTSSLKTRAETKGYDNILFGSCTIENGSYVITMNAYDLALDKITYSGSTEVESIFDTFEAVDEITYQTVEGFSGIHVTYGSLVLVPPDTGEPFSFTIDGIALPEGTFSVERMPAGVHELSISQVRPFEWYEAVHEIIVEEEKENRIEILLPDIAGEEVTVFNRADRYLIIASLGEKAAAIRAVDNLNGLLRTSFFREYRSGLVEKYGAWISLLDREFTSFDEPDYFVVNYSAKSLWQSNYRNFTNNSVSLSSQYQIALQTSEALNLNMNLLADIRTITLDGKSDDWDLVSDYISDPVGDIITPANIDQKGRDIVSVKAAIDNDNLYLMMQTSDNKYKIPNTVYSFHIGENPVILAHFSTYSKEFWVSKYYSHTNNKVWEYMTTKIKYAIGSVFEISIPIKDLFKATELGESTDFHYDIIYSGDNSGWIDMEEYTGNNGILILPLSEALIRKDS